MQKLLFLFALQLVMVFDAHSQPYEGAAYVNTNLINFRDYSTFEKVIYKEEGTRNIFDRRVDKLCRVRGLPNLSLF